MALSNAVRLGCNGAGNRLAVGIVVFIGFLNKMADSQRLFNTNLASTELI
jgi:hypothetical protein